MTENQPAAKPAVDADTERAAGPRERIVGAASDLFYENGMHAVSADRIIAAARVSKVTFYRYFKTKEDLIAVYLDRRAELERDAIGPVFAELALQPALRALADGIGSMTCSTGFRGCPFINASAEYPDREHPIRQIVERHRAWYTEVFTSSLRAAGIPQSAQVARELLMIRDGAMMMGYLGAPDEVADSLYWSMAAVAEFRGR